MAAVTSEAAHDTGDGDVRHRDSTVRRTVSVKGSGGVTATLVVTARRGQVWVSIDPPFTWSAIMEPAEVDELIHTLAEATEDAQRTGGLRPVAVAVRLEGHENPTAR